VYASSERIGCLGGYGQGRTAIAQQLTGPLINADTRPFGVIRFFVQIEQVFQLGDERGTRCRDAPLRL
jgi:hypothetical protein